MAFTDKTNGSRVIEQGVGMVKITLGADCSVGDAIGYNAGWVLADGNGVYPAVLVAGQTALSGAEIQAYRAARISGITTGTAGDKLYLSDTAGDYSATKGTFSQVVGHELGGGEMWIEPEDEQSSFADNIKLIFGGGNDVEVYWDGTNLLIVTAADDSLIEIGDSAATQLSFDIKWYGNSASGADYLYFDASANLIYTTGVDLQFKDSDLLVFGTGAGGSGDVNIKWDGTNLIVTAIADDTLIEIGDSAATQLSFDVKIYGDAASGADYVLFDASASRLDMSGAYALGLHRRKPVTAKTASYTCLAADSGTIFTTTGAGGAVVFTLPAVTLTGWTARFINTVAQDMTVASAAGDDMVVFNDAAADSIAFTTASEEIGGALEVVSDGTNWLVFVMLGSETQTPSIVT